MISSIVGNSFLRSYFLIPPQRIPKVGFTTCLLLSTFLQNGLDDLTCLVDHVSTFLDLR